jgi:hypothetical protein
MKNIHKNRLKFITYDNFQVFLAIEFLYLSNCYYSKQSKIPKSHENKVAHF